MASWQERAETALGEDNKEPIKADATQLTKFGAPTAAVVALLATTLLGDSWNLDPKRAAVVFAAAIIVAAVVLGMYFAFATDVHTRGQVTIARLEAIAQLAQAEETRRLKDALAEAEKERDEAKADLEKLRTAKVALDGLGVTATVIQAKPMG